MKPVIAIVGRPNVGKSLLFNRLTGTRASIVEDTPGVTRDRLYAEGEWRGRPFTLIDTGGIEPHTDNEILKFMRAQAEIAIEHADVIIFLTDLQTGVTAADEDVSAMLKRCGKPVVLCVNKVDTPGETPPGVYEFYNLGMGDPIPVSSLHGTGTGDLLDACYDHLPTGWESEEVEDDIIKVAVVGRPNSGKSSLINRILGENRVIVSDIPGTTRDAVDSYFENEHGKFLIIDTAGIRRKSKIELDIEKYSILRALMAMDRADVCIIMLDASEGVTEQDTKVAGFVNEKGKPSIIAVNKWDLIEKDNKTFDIMKTRVAEDLSFMRYAPINFISAKTGQRVDGLLKTCAHMREQSRKRISTGTLNEFLADAVSRVQPPTDRGKRLKIYYMTQTGVRPPTFVAFCNDIELFHYSYKRYIENRLRETFDFEGTPIRIFVRQRGD